MIDKQATLDILNRDKIRLMGFFNHELGDKEPKRKEAEFLTFPFKIEQPDRETFAKKYKAFAERIVNLLRSEKAETVTSIQIIPLDEPAYIKYKLEVTVE